MISCSRRLAKITSPSSLPLVVVSQFLLLLLLPTTTFALEPNQAFIPLARTRRKTLTKTTAGTTATTATTMNNNNPCPGGDSGMMHPSTLTGDPSLMLTTNVDLGDKKMEVMKSISKAINTHTGKPESYIAVSIIDNASVIFGASDAPCALACMYSIGAIATESNGAITSDVTDLLEPFGVAADRIYINFFDVPRANCGWNRRTFAG